MSTSPGIVAILLLLTLAITAEAEETPIADPPRFVHGTVVAPRYGEFVLIRKGTQVCAVKFDQAWRGNDSKEGSFWNSGDESFRANYRWYYVDLSKDRWSPQSAELKAASVSSGPTVGPGKFGATGGSSDVSCGPLTLRWIRPTSIAFSGKREGYKLGDYGYELALTNSPKVEDTDPTSQSVIWYRYDDKRSKVVPQ